ncbi:hypothetical protein K492DRAFT_195012 [Lichtheimia hyalospora FSU 10163]|nr:hypothetical protein K492DRAFT_195012 [Lichtheimia hyalospora FSU 10163]
MSEDETYERVHDRSIIYSSTRQCYIYVDAIDDKRGDLTPFCKHMASIPADLRISKMLLLGSIFGCLDPVLTVAATISLKSPFTAPMERREEAR